MGRLDQTSHVGFRLTGAIEDNGSFREQQFLKRYAQDLKTRFDSQLSRMNCQTFSTGVSSGHLGVSGISVMLGGTTSSADPCHPAGSSRRTACAVPLSRATLPLPQ